VEIIENCLYRERGGSIDELIAATDWLPHTMQAAL
jgi:hypothetical protein